MWSRRGLCFPTVVLAVLIMPSCSHDDPLDATTSACDQPGNLVQNCGFDSNTEGWRVNVNETGTYVSDDGASRRGSLEVTGRQSGTEYFADASQCINLPSGPTYDLGAYIRVVEGMPDSCQLGVVGYLDATCRNSAGNLWSVPIVARSSWGRSPSFSITVPIQPSFAIYPQCRGSLPFRIRVDDISLIAR